MQYPQYRVTGTWYARCAKIQYRTRTRVTRFGNTAGIPVPVRNPRLWHPCHQTLLPRRKAPHLSSNQTSAPAHFALNVKIHAERR